MFCRTKCHYGTSAFKISRRRSSRYAGHGRAKDDPTPVVEEFDLACPKDAGLREKTRADMEKILSDDIRSDPSDKPDGAVRSAGDGSDKTFGRAVPKS